MDQLLPLAARVASMLKARDETVAVAESSSGGLVSAALLAQQGASAYFLGGGVIYTARARRRLLGLTGDDVRGLRSASEPYAELLAKALRSQLSSTWGVAETGAAGPASNPYGDAAGHSCLAVSGPISRTKTLETGQGDRVQNMLAFAEGALLLLEGALTSNLTVASPPQREPKL